MPRCKRGASFNATPRDALIVPLQLHVRHYFETYL
jgi:hypothetical protein